MGNLFCIPRKGLVFLIHKKTAMDKKSRELKRLSLMIIILAVGLLAILSVLILYGL